MDRILHQDKDLNQKDIENLRDYKYKPGEYTILDNQLNKFWLAAVEYLPRDLAPNLITVYALASVAVPALLFVFYDATLLSTYPSIMYVLAALGLFLYQTLDALDGKQARRINAKSPLGQLFDHGCDSFSTAIIVVLMLVCLKMECACLNLAAYLGYITIVWCSNLCEHFTGVMNTSVGQFGVSEIQCLQMLLLLLTAVGGMDWLKLPLGTVYTNQGSTGLKINDIVGYAIIVSTSITSFALLKETFKTYKDYKKVAMTSLPFLYVFFMCTLQVIDRLCLHD